jgi:hypothetical protein
VYTRVQALREALSRAETELASTRSALTAKEAELAAYQAGATDKERAIIKVHMSGRGVNSGANPVGSWLSIATCSCYVYEGHRV